ncbi:hypothetical protein AC578_5973 [Pseudocercospora eumusae]|uniref:Extracellular membrane protein CFEM domain-containing protein n=1 Tax=Pseudocercospora eumusae TaxID=321146 RepID=A0A139HID4_9PEZI|nr:hypothetical protein AC578_5973 [Pseudocercospora eumusae]
MRVITIATAALSLTTAVFAEFKGDKRACALCLTEAGGLSGCEAKAHGIPSMTCLCNYPGYSVYKGCNYFCAGPEGWPEKAPGNACKNWTTNAMTEMFTTTSTTTDDKKVVDRAAFATEVSNPTSLPGSWRNKWIFPHWWGGARHGGHRIGKGGYMGMCGVDGVSCAHVTHQHPPDTGPARSVSASRGVHRTDMLTTPSQQGGHALPNTAAELGSQHLAVTTQSHPTIEVALSGHQAAAHSAPTITTTIHESDAYSMGLITHVSISTTGPNLYSTLTASPNGTIEARSKVKQGPYQFCGVPGGACPNNKEANILRTYSFLFPNNPRLTLLATPHPVPTILSKRHEDHNDTAARWPNTTYTEFNSTSRPGGQPPTGAAAESKGRKMDSNQEKVWLIAVLTAGIVAFAQIKRTL